MKQAATYPNIDMFKTGQRLKKYIEYSGMSVKEVQEYLQLSCPQPIYRWIAGKILPSVDHLLVLSELFGVHMEELLVKKKNNVLGIDAEGAYSSFDTRIYAYCRRVLVLNA